jgi:hypothetical protein
MNNEEVITALLLKDKRVNPAASSSWALRVASSNGSLTIVKQLLQGTNSIIESHSK